MMEERLPALISIDTRRANAGLIPRERLYVEAKHEVIMFFSSIDFAVTCVQHQNVPFPAVTITANQGD